jgi:hypothetical protein
MSERAAFKLAVVNEAALPDADVAAFVAAAEEWIGKWLAPFWPEVAGSTIRTATPGTVAAEEAQIVLAPTTTMANSLGYHEKSPSGLPIGIVELDACLKYGVAWTIAGTHEIGELLINPALDRFAAAGSRQYPVEIADPVTSDSFAIGGVMVSNAVTPAWWDPAAPPGSRFDIMALVTQPLPEIPHRGWLEWSENGVYSSAYGTDMAPNHIAYMRARHGRRWRLRHPK